MDLPSNHTATNSFSSNNYFTNDTLLEQFFFLKMVVAYLLAHQIPASSLFSLQHSLSPVISLEPTTSRLFETPSRPTTPLATLYEGLSMELLEVNLRLA